MSRSGPFVRMGLTALRDPMAVGWIWDAWGRAERSARGELDHHDRVRAMAGTHSSRRVSGVQSCWVESVRRDRRREVVVAIEMVYRR